MIIQKSAGFFDVILGKQSIEKNKKYRISPFVLIVKYETVFLLFNNLSKKLIYLNNNDFDSLPIKYSIQEDKTVKITDFYFIENDILNELIQDYFFVPHDMNMVEVSDNLKSTLKLLKSNIDEDIYSYIIFPTTACNARCFYCFEAGIEPVTMTEETANNVANFIIKNSGEKRVFLSWFGGEPLCNTKAIDIICSRLKDAGKKYGSNFTSNGYLFDEEMIEKSVDLWNIELLNITIDGLKDTYNKVKNYKNNDKNAYNRILRNISLLLKKNVSVKIRLNMDMHNADELKELVVELHKNFGEYEKCQIYVRPLYENIASWKFSRTNEERDLVREKYNDLEKLIESYGMSNIRPLEKNIILYRCLADQPISTMINPKGELGYCEHYPLSDMYGSIYDDKSKKGIWSTTMTASEDCYECVGYPSCVRLKKCKDGREECFKYDQDLRKRIIRLSMINEYKKFVKKQSEEK